jgi:hypothetical protein
MNGRQSVTAAFAHTTVVIRNIEGPLTYYTTNTGIDLGGQRPNTSTPVKRVMWMLSMASDRQRTAQFEREICRVPAARSWSDFTNNRISSIEIIWPNQTQPGTYVA